MIIHSYRRLRHKRAYPQTPLGQGLGDLRARSDELGPQLKSGANWPKRASSIGGVNFLAFGLTGAGRPHTLCTVGHSLAEAVNTTQSAGQSRFNE